jgi:Photosynthetic reaction centre cytochrome C subunit
VKLGSRPTILCATGIAAACLLGVAPLTGQTASDQKPLMVEDVFKNVQVLKGTPVTEFMATMGLFSASLGFHCTNCHTAESLGNWTKHADDVPTKRTARRMIRMVETRGRGPLERVIGRPRRTLAANFPASPAAANSLN